MLKISLVFSLLFSQVLSNPLEAGKGLRGDDDRIVNGRDALLGKKF